MKCKEKSCKGEIDFEKSVPLQTGCISVSIGYPCKKCGRLHWKDGNAVNNRAGQKAFLSSEGNVIHKSKKTVRVEKRCKALEEDFESKMTMES